MVAHTLLAPLAALGLLGVAHAAPSPISQTGFVNVTIATLWTDSTKPRPIIDDAAVSSPPDIPKWLSTMTKEDFLDLSGSSRTQTQALYGSKVIITDALDGWYKVAVTSQISPSQPLGYPGWVPSSQVALHEPLFQQLQEKRPFALVNKGVTASLYHDLLLKRKAVDLSYNTRLPVIVKIGKAVQVAVPGGIAYLSADEVSVFKTDADIPYPTGEDLIKAGSMFLGRPYLWGGSSGYGFDCSGFTGTMYQAHGITIGRDAAPQAYFTNTGPIIDRADLQAGDLIFYANNLTNPKSIYHVAMYAGNGEMLEAYASGTPTRRTPVRFSDTYYGAKRYLVAKK